MADAYLPGRGHRVVLDTATLIAALRSGAGAAREVVNQILQQEVTILLDLKLSLEYRAVALRPEHLSVIKLTRAEVLAAIEELEAVAEAVVIESMLRPVSVDPNDDMIIELAVAAQADAIISPNLRHLQIATSRFNIAVLTPSDWLREKGR